MEKEIVLYLYNEYPSGMPKAMTESEFKELVEKSFEEEILEDYDDGFEEYINESYNACDFLSYVPADDLTLMKQEYEKMAKNSIETRMKCEYTKQIVKIKD